MKRYFWISALALALSGCRPEAPDLFLTEQHPALPFVQAGKPIPAPSALKPELMTVRPELPQGLSGNRGLLSPQARDRVAPRMPDGHGAHKM